MVVDCAGSVCGNVGGAGGGTVCGVGYDRMMVTVG